MTCNFERKKFVLKTLISVPIRDVWAVKDGKAELPCDIAPPDPTDQATEHQLSSSSIISALSLGLLGAMVQRISGETSLQL